MGLELTTIRHLCPFSSKAGPRDLTISFKLDCDAAAAAEGSREGGATELLDGGSKGDLHIVPNTTFM